MKTRIYFITILIVMSFCIFSYAALDLKFTTAISMSPASPKAGDNITFAVSFKAEGEAATDIKIIGLIDGTQVHERIFASIPADATRSDSFTWTAVAGNHTVSFTLDPSHTSGDSNYNNNTVSKTFNVSGTGGDINMQDVLAKKKVNIKPSAKTKPDLVGIMGVYPDENGNFGCTQTWHLTLFIKNEGRNHADRPFKNQVITDLTHEVFSCYIESLPVREEAQCHWSFHFIPEIGHMWFQSTVDINGAIDESIETNNVYEMSQYCVK